MSKKRMMIKNLCRATSLVSAIAFISLSAHPALADCTSPASPEGGLAYFAVDDTYRYCDSTDTWVTLASGSTSLWTDNTTHITRETFHVLDAGQTMTSASWDGVNVPGIIWHPDKRAFRGGQSSTFGAWNEANIGLSSFAFGDGSRATGANSTAFGQASQATGNFAFAAGDQSVANGTAAVALGRSTTNGIGAVAIGYGADATNNNAVALGETIDVTGLNAFGFGLGEASGTAPIVSGASSLGIFMGDQSGQDLTSANTMAVMGGDFIVGSTQLDDTTTGSEDIRMFFDVSKGAFRAGATNLTEWDNANVGNYSVAFGLNNQAIGLGSMAMGQGHYVTGDHAMAIGGDNSVAAHNSLSVGFDANTSNGGRISAGLNTSASGLDQAFAFGQDVTASGSRSVAWGLGDATGTHPEVSGANTFGIFMGDQSGYDLTTSNRMALVGGDFLIDDDGTAGSQGCIRYLEGTGLQYSNDCSTFSTFGTSTSPFRVTGAAGSEVVNNNATAPAVTADFVFGSYQLDDTGNAAEQSRFFFDKSKSAFRAGSVTGAQWDTTNVGDGSFAAGNQVTASGEISAALGAATASAYAAFATGESTASSDYAVAMGESSTASGYAAIALGESAIASGTGSVALGSGAEALAAGAIALGSSANVASQSGVAIGENTDSNGLRDISIGYNAITNGTGAIAIGQTVSSTSLNSIALGHEVSVLGGGGGFGEYSMAIGLGNSSTATYPQVTGASTLGIFMGDQNGVSVTDDNVMVIMGGNVGIGTVSPASNLEIYNNTASPVLDIKAGTASSGYDPTLFLSTSGQYGEIRFDQSDRNLYIKNNYNDSTDHGIKVITGGFSDAQPILTIEAKGNAGLGIWDPTPDAYLEITSDPTTGTSPHFMISSTEAGNGDLFFVSNAGLVGIGNASPSVELDVTGDIEYSGTITDVSDKRLKDNITPLNKNGSLLARINAIDTYSFTMKDDKSGRIEYGVMAQELEKIFPDLVHTAKDEIGTKSVNYMGLIAPMIEASQELSSENNRLKERLSELEASHSTTAASLNTLTKQVERLNKLAANNVDKASMKDFILLLFAILAGMTIMFGLQRRNKI